MRSRRSELLAQVEYERQTDGSYRVGNELITQLGKSWVYRQETYPTLTDALERLVDNLND